MGYRREAVIEVPSGAWDPSGSEEDPTSRLLCCLIVNNTAHHLEAYAVTNEPLGLQRAVDPLFESNVDAMYRLASEPDQAFQTTEIAGRTYVIALTPHCV